jgi:class 3 adenylate cyclase
MFLNRKACYSLIGLLCFTSFLVSAQDQKLADSLFTIHQEGKIEGIERLELLRNLAFNEINNLEAALKYAEELIKLSKQEANYLYLHRGYIQKGNTHRLLGDLNAALDAFFKSAEASIKANYIEGEGNTYTAIADTYSEIGNSDNAEIYYDKAIRILRKTNDSIPLATTLLNAGDEYFNSKKYEAALRNYEESGLIFKKANYNIGTAYNLGNVGMVYAEQGKESLAKSNINEAITILEELKDYYAISEYLTYMSDIYSKQQNSAAAITYAQRSFDLAVKHGLKKQISESSLKLSELHERAKNIPASYAFYKQHIAFRDSVTNLEGIAKMADLRTNYEVSQKQVEVDLLNQQKRNQLIILGFTSLLLLTLFWYYRTISKEKKKSEKLLLNILPEETAKELKKHGKVKAKKFDSVTVLFTDFKGFTSYAENLSPEVLVESIDYYFSKFDTIMETYGLEKIKTIGDAYMCAGGLNKSNTNHAHKMVRAAIDIAEFVKKSKQNTNNNARFEIRIGISTGPVVAGIVGIKKFAYDIWGDTVNIASRMESNSEPGKINISQQTYTLVKDNFDCDFRGQLAVKNRGSLNMYFVKSEIPETENTLVKQA